MNKALGLIEVVGLSTAITALDEACDTADVTVVGFERVIGAGGAVSVTIQLAGDVAAVRAGVEAGADAAQRVGTVLSQHVMPRPHDEVQQLIDKFKDNLKEDKSQSSQSDSSNKTENQSDSDQKQQTEKGKKSKSQS